MCVFASQFYPDPWGRGLRYIEFMDAGTTPSSQRYYHNEFAKVVLETVQRNVTLVRILIHNHCSIGLVFAYSYVLPIIAPHKIEIGL